MQLLEMFSLHTWVGVSGLEDAAARHIFWRSNDQSNWTELFTALAPGLWKLAKGIGHLRNTHYLKTNSLRNTHLKTNCGLSVGSKRSGTLEFPLGHFHFLPGEQGSVEDLSPLLTLEKAGLTGGGEPMETGVPPQ